MQVIKPGDNVEGYKILSELGRGAESFIYLAQDIKSKQVYALKHVPKKKEDKDNRFLEQAEKEYEIASKLEHAGIRRIERLIRVKDGFFSVSAILLLMELVDGEPLDRTPPKTFESAADIFEQVARAMAYMHAKGFVHADMKPNNIMVCPDGRAKIIDLGQACPMNTVKKRIQGTPDYIAPEQVHREPITAKTDVYNLGATMYWAFTKKFVPTALPKGDSLLGKLDASLMERPKRTVEINARVPELLDQLIMDCVEIEQADRPESMTAVAERLNLIKARLLAEADLRKSGSFRKVNEDSMNGMKRAAGASGVGMKPPTDAGPGVRASA